MIPKIIHYCWFGKGLMPKSQIACIKSWKKFMPDYEIIRWDESNFDVNMCPFSKWTYGQKIFSPVSDVCRYYALRKYGGVYMDTDVEVYKRFDDFLNTDFFSALEFYPEFYKDGYELLDPLTNLPKVAGTEIPNLEMLTSTMGCVAGNCIIQDCLDFYLNIEVDAQVASDFRDFVNNDTLVARIATKYGFRYIDEKQYLSNNMIIYPTGIFGHAFCINPEYSVSYHYNAASWERKTNKQERMLLLDKLHLLKFYKAIRAFKNKIQSSFKF